MRIIFWAVALFVVIFAAVYFPPIITLGTLGIILTLALIVHHFEASALIVIFLYPFLGIIIDFSRFESIRTIPYLGAVNAPITDIAGMFLAAAWLITLVALIWRGMNTPDSLRLQLSSIRLPAFAAAAAFWTSGVLSLTKVPQLWLAGSVKYLLRPMLFFYVVFVAPIVNALRSERMVRAALWAMWIAGMIAALFGIASFFVAPSVGFPRATVFSIGSFAPMGTNHNLLAETLVVTAPLGLALKEWYTRRIDRRWIMAGSFLQLAIALLTFARTAWIVLVIQAFIWALTAGRTKTQHVMRRLKPAMILFVPLVIVMTFVSLSEVVQSSTMTRADMARISLFYWERSPIIGQGVGTYIPSLWTIRAFTRDYGAPLEAHGVIWKLLFEQGVLGVLTFGVLIAWCLVRAFRAWRMVYWSSGRTIMASILMMMSGAAVYQLFNTMYYSSKLWVPMGVGLAASYLYGSSKHTH